MADFLDALFAKIASPKDPVPAGPAEWLLVGLGNPGSKYEGTRHNVGFMAIDAIAAKYGIRVKEIRFKGLIGTGVIGGHKVILLKPSTYMNLSGQSVQEALAFYKIAPDHCLVFCDDVSLDAGRIRVRRKGSDGGHNGLKNIIYLTASDEFPRIRFGVGKKPHPEMDLADWVLGHFDPVEQEKMKRSTGQSPEIAELVLSGKIEEAMSRFNSFGVEPKMTEDKETDDD